MGPTYFFSDNDDGDEDDDVDDDDDGGCCGVISVLLIVKFWLLPLWLILFPTVSDDLYGVIMYYTIILP